MVAVADLTETPVDGTDLHAGLTIRHPHPTEMDTHMAMHTVPRRMGHRILLVHPLTTNLRGNLTLRLSLDLVESVRMEGRLHKAMGEVTQTTSGVVLGADLLEVVLHEVVLPEVVPHEVVLMAVLPEAEVHRGVGLQGTVAPVTGSMGVNLRRTGEGDIMGDIPVPVEEAKGVVVVDRAGMAVMVTSQAMAATAPTTTHHQVVGDMVVTLAVVLVVVATAAPILPEAEVVVAGSRHVNLFPLTNGLCK